MPSASKKSARPSALKAARFLALSRELLRRGLIRNPSRASRIAGSNSVAHSSRPCAVWALAASAILPGTPTLSPLRTESMKGGNSPVSLRNQSGVAPEGAVSRPSKVVTEPPASPRTRNPPPPIPELCGSTTVSASITAIAASVALPPRARISSPAACARGSAALTAPVKAGASVRGSAVSACVYVMQPDRASAASERGRARSMAAMAIRFRPLGQSTRNPRAALVWRGRA